MAISFHLTIVALVSIIFICSSVFAESGNSPFLVAHKRVSHRKLNSDLELLSVSIDIYNAGSEIAYDVTLNDDSWTQEVFYSIIGNTSMTWEQLASGSLVSHSFELESKVKTVYYGAPALITYRVPTKSRPQEAYSTPIPPLRILSDPIEKKIEIAKRLLGKYSSHVSVTLFLILFANIFTSPSKTSAGKKKH